MAYALILAGCSPLFFMLTLGLTPGALGGLPVFLIVWAASSAVVGGLLLAVAPAPDAAAGWEAAGAAAVGGVVPPTPLSPRAKSAPPDGSSVLGLVPRGIARWRAGQRPRCHVALALLAFLQCIVWLNAAADELVALFEAVGGIWNVRRDILGATVLAWGETVPDLVAVLSLARSGQGTMAIAACFGGPVFNLLVSMGGPIMVAAAKNGPVEYHLTSGVVVLVAVTALVLALLLVVVPFPLRWGLPPAVGMALLLMYAASQVVFLLAEGSVI